ncbi:MAG: hypothetical protein K0M40_02525 [Prolixibacteraceae bacterium]|nr:hypothetical protein [Prolixibacteraceae bacterium]
MHKFCFITFCFSIVFVSYSYGMGSTKKPDYARVLNQSIFRLNSHPKSQRAKRKVTETYYQAIHFYQQEIDRILMDNEPLKWTKTLDILENVNGLGDEIRYNSVASQLICEPKIYTSEIDDAKTKAVAELYQAGEDCLQQNSKEKAKEAYFYFKRAAQLNPGYKDIADKIKEAQNYGTLKVLIEPLELDFKTVDVLTEKLDKEFFYWTQQNVSKRNFVHFYSLEELTNQNASPDLIIQLFVQNFRINERPTIKYRNVQMPRPTKQLVLIDGKYTWIPVEGTHSSQLTENSFVSHELIASGNLFLKITDVADNRIVFKRGISCEYHKDANFRLKVNSVNRSIRDPDIQNFFDQLFLNNFEKVTEELDFYFTNISAGQ